MAKPPLTAPEGAACVAHRYHRPNPEYCELHHVIPQAWQHFWAPPTGRSAAGSIVGLFDPRTVPLCPTGHRNVHWWIVRLMRVAASTAEESWEKLPSRGRRKTSEQTIALLTLQRWVDAGGDLAVLRTAGLWGEA